MGKITLSKINFKPGDVVYKIGIHHVVNDIIESIEINQTNIIIHTKYHKCEWNINDVYKTEVEAEKAFKEIRERMRKASK